MVKRTQRFDHQDPKLPPGQKTHLLAHRPKRMRHPRAYESLREWVSPSVVSGGVFLCAGTPGDNTTGESNIVWLTKGLVGDIFCRIFSYFED